MVEPWWIWAYWVSPFTYAQLALSVNEFSSNGWMKKSVLGGDTLGHSILRSHSLPTRNYWLVQIVVSRTDGRLALGRLGALCEQLKELNSRGFEVILVTSGAVGVGRQRLRYRKLIHSSFADLQKPQTELDGKAFAAVGQNGLMALYDALFTQLDVTSSQLLVTDNDFRDSNFRKQLSETVKSLLDLKVIPIFNENDAISTRSAPYETLDIVLARQRGTEYQQLVRDSSGIFWDNDSLAALLALELKADLLILLSDVEGLYSGPPSDPQPKLIDTYIKEKHHGEITFRGKSRVGRGGMTAKVKAAINATYAGILVVLTRNGAYMDQTSGFHGFLVVPFDGRV
ncbi:hypothetical protein Syun_000814 [Stephania yunnanensis]|uniref:Aspartate/glutamate/uridylate kinase domain-containing protein n=1 Tax=Stephania yunnanensis TaxID=152371 RepID=A0AAP0LGN7_9MAGN